MIRCTVFWNLIPVLQLMFSPSLVLQPIFKCILPYWSLMRGSWHLTFLMVGIFPMDTRCLNLSSRAFRTSTDCYLTNKTFNRCLVAVYDDCGLVDLIPCCKCDNGFLAPLQTDTKKISAVSIFFETMPYRLNEATGYIDYDQVNSNRSSGAPLDWDFHQSYSWFGCLLWIHT